MTHRVFSRNTSSSRAIPAEKMMEKIKENPFHFEYWGKDQSGMSAREELSGENLTLAKAAWKNAYLRVLEEVKKLKDLGLHKQSANRALEPWSWITNVITTTELDNFFNQRVHKDAQPEFQVIAKMMKDCVEKSTPNILQDGEWHLPFWGTDGDLDYYEDQLDKGTNIRTIKDGSEEMKIDVRQLISVGRCARTSYLTHDGERDPEKDVYLTQNTLLGSVPPHWSPFEHICTPMKMNEWVYRTALMSEMNDMLDNEGVPPSEQILFSRNLRGFHSLRSLIDHA